MSSLPEAAGRRKISAVRELAYTALLPRPGKYFCGFRPPTCKNWRPWSYYTGILLRHLELCSLELGRLVTVIATPRQVERACVAVVYNIQDTYTKALMQRRLWQRSSFNSDPIQMKLELLNNFNLHKYCKANSTKAIIVCCWPSNKRTLLLCALFCSRVHCEAQ